MGRPREATVYDEGEPVPQDLDERSLLIEHMLTTVEDSFHDSSSSNEFIEDLRDHFDRRGVLSDKQVEALKKFYRRAC